jgi:hypothetical protein
MAQGNYGGGGFSPQNPSNPYSSMGTYGQAPPPKKSNALLWILGIVLGGGILVCGCCGVLGYMGMGGVGSQLGGMLKAQIQNDPVIQEHIGPIEDVSWELMQTANIQQTHPEISGQVQVFKVKGPKGEGLVFGAQVDSPSPSRILRNPILQKNGQEYPLSP